MSAVTLLPQTVTFQGTGGQVQHMGGHGSTNDTHESRGRVHSFSAGLPIILGCNLPGSCLVLSTQQTGAEKVKGKQPPTLPHSGAVGSSHGGLAPPVSVRDVGADPFP